MFQKILIANRGEIACRIIRTARRMGLATVAVYSEADKDALHVLAADEAVAIGPPPAAASYLHAERILAAARQTGAEAVHPGYGFLSENAAFAQAVLDAGLAFIGPGPDAMRHLGDKLASKRIAAEAGVNTIPGHPDAVASPDEAVAIARRLGYPVMLKASAGGGGKGMRIARSDEECREGFARAASEALTSFGDDRLLLEKCIEQPRHIEIQILADAHCHVIHLGERECSLQRRHQKVLEESPSPMLDARLREAMGAQAVALARAVGYRSAGTVEFVADSRGNFYFLEMNTRLQVEHPITEETYGIDLVEWMIRIAVGERLTLQQHDLRPRGWAIEARIYAEDPLRNFLPSTGRLVRYVPPPQDAGVRVDSGVYEGGEISIHYDPMIAKLIAHAPTRTEAIDKLRDALNAFCIRGVAHNVSFLAALVRQPRFLEGRLTTHLIADAYPQGFRYEDVVHDEPWLIIAVAAVIHYRYMERASRISGQLPGYERILPADWVVILDGAQHPVHVRPAEGGYVVAYDGKRLIVRSPWQFGQMLFTGSVNEQPVCMQVERRQLAYRLQHWGAQSDVLVLNQRAADLLACMPAKPAPDMSRFLLSPMPGLLTTLRVAAGDQVRTGQELAVVEAMKMENVLRAERDGQIAKVHAAVGESLAVDQPILEYA